MERNCFCIDDSDTWSYTVVIALVADWRVYVEIFMLWRLISVTTAVVMSTVIQPRKSVPLLFFNRRRTHDFFIWAALKYLCDRCLYFGRCPLLSFSASWLLALADHFLSICHCCTLAYTSHVVVMAGQQDCGWDVEGSWGKTSADHEPSNSVLSWKQGGQQCITYRELCPDSHWYHSPAG